MRTPNWDRGYRVPYGSLISESPFHLFWSPCSLVGQSSCPVSLKLSWFIVRNQGMVNIQCNISLSPVINQGKFILKTKRRTKKKTHQSWSDTCHGPLQDTWHHQSKARSRPTSILEDLWCHLPLLVTLHAAHSLYGSIWMPKFLPHHLVVPCKHLR